MDAGYTQKYGISSDTDFKRVKQQVNTLNKTNLTPNRVYDYIIKIQNVNGRMVAKFIETYYVTKYTVTYGQLPRGNMLPTPWVK